MHRHAGRRRTRVRPLRLLAAWLGHHRQSASASIARLLRNPLSTSMTLAVIAIALALPAGLYLLTLNLHKLGASWSQTTAVSLFLKKDTSIAQAQELAAKLEAHPELDRVTLISPDEALAELGSQTGFSDSIAQLEENPLPAEYLP